MTYAPSFKFARSYLQTRSGVLLTHSCAINRPTVGTEVTYDSNTKLASQVPPTEVYVGSCRLWAINAPNDFFYQERETHRGTTNLSLPAIASGVRPNDVVTILTHSDPEMVGRSLTVIQVNRGGELRKSRIMSVEFVDYVEAPSE